MVAGAGPLQGLHRDARPNGYQSLHTSVVGERGLPFEIQIRTEEMHRIAEEGIAAHWKYKEGRVGAERDEQYVPVAAAAARMAAGRARSAEFLRNLRIELYSDEVYVFTPKGEVIALPRGATPVDFAYASTPTWATTASAPASTAGWCRCDPARERRHRRDPPAAGHKPSRDWLNFVATSRARNKIRHFHPGRGKDAQHRSGQAAVRQGRSRRFNMDKALVTDEALRVASEYGAQRADDLYAAIGYGKATARAVLTRLVGQDALRERRQTARSRASSNAFLAAAKPRSKSGAWTT